MRYAEDPAAYFSDILGVRMIDKIEEVLEAILRHDKVAVKSCHDFGKTFTEAGAVTWIMDCRGPLPDPDEPTREQGAIVLLPGPTEKQVLQSVWREVLGHIRRAERRGFKMPGIWSERSVTWYVPGHENWFVTSIHPQGSDGELKSHAASGRHHSELWAFLEEANGLKPALWKGVHGMCATDGNKMVAFANPTEGYGPFKTHCEKPSWHVVTLSAFDHPNIIERQPVIRQAIGLKFVENFILDSCRPIGPYPGIIPDPTHHDFIYGLPEDPELIGVADGQVREDGHLGHPDAPLQVWRPVDEQFPPQVLGEFPKTSSSGLFDGAAWQRAEERALSREGLLEFAPDAVGVDPTGGSDDGDTPAYAPRYGDDIQALLKRYLTAEEDGDLEEMRRILAEDRILIGRIGELAGNDGDAMALELDEIYPDSAWVMDPANQGSVMVAAARRIRRDREYAPPVAEINFRRNPFKAGAAGFVLAERLEPEPLCADARSMMYYRFAWGLRLGLVDIMPDDRLREECLALKVQYKTVFDGEEKRSAVEIVSKAALKKIIKRSPDYSDAVVLAATQVVTGDSGAAVFWRAS